jgi:hypothetical protein
MTSDETPSRLLLKEWERRTRTHIDAHNWAERRFDRLNSACLLLSIATLTALGVLAAAFNLTVGNNRYVVVGLSILAATASVLLGIRDYGSKAATHRLAARGYGGLRRQIEVSSLISSEADLTEAIASIERKWNDLSDLAPNVPQRLRDRAEQVSRPARLI